MKKIMSLFLLGIVGVLDVFAMQRTKSAPVQLARTKQVGENGGTKTTSSKIKTLQAAILADDRPRFRELVGTQITIDNTATFGDVASTLAHCVVYAYTLKGAGKNPVYCQNPEKDAENLIQWFMLLTHLHASLSAKDGKGRTVEQLALLKAEQYRVMFERHKAMAPEQAEFFAMLEQIPVLMGQASERYVSLTLKQASDNDFREYFSLQRIEDDYE